MYENLDKNTVDSKNQLGNAKYVRFSCEEKDGLKILFAGNSITLHSIKEDIGWFNECGMAASCPENDYVHKTVKILSQNHPQINHCIVQVAEWERRYKEGSSVLGLYENARDFDADIIVMRCGENCPKDDFDSKIFKQEFDKLLNFFNPNKTAKVILTTCFWHHPADESIIEYGKEKNLPVMPLGDLGDMDKMKATGLFWHGGVAHHPGDLGMQNIAERIANSVLENIEL